MATTNYPVSLLAYSNGTVIPATTGTLTVDTTASTVSLTLQPSGTTTYPNFTNVAATITQCGTQSSLSTKVTQQQPLALQLSLTTLSTKVVTMNSAMGLVGWAILQPASTFAGGMVGITGTATSTGGSTGA